MLKAILLASVALAGVLLESPASATAWFGWVPPPRVVHHKRHHHHRSHHHSHYSKVVRVPHNKTGRLPPSEEGPIIEKALSFVGTNPTDWSHNWCAHFLAWLMPEVAAQLDNPDSALSWAELPHVSARVGSIAVLRRSGGGHVGIVMGFADGNPILLSGNHSHRVGIGTYPAGRVVAYVTPFG